MPGRTCSLRAEVSQPHVALKVRSRQRLAGGAVDALHDRQMARLSSSAATSGRRRAHEVLDRNQPSNGRTNTHVLAAKTLLAENYQLLEVRLATKADLVDHDVDADSPNGEAQPGLRARNLRWFAR